MRTIRTKVYTFNELNKEAQEKAIIDYRNGNDDLQLLSFNEDCNRIIEERGFRDVSLSYSLSYSQGDGLSFTASNIENSILISFFREILGENKEKTIQVLIDNCSFELTGNRGRYNYASKSDIDYTLEDYGHNDTINCNIVVAKVLEKLENYYIDLCKELEKNGYNELEYLNSDEYIKDVLINNEYEFLSNGKIY